MKWKRGEIWQINPQRPTTEELIEGVKGSEMSKIPRWVVVLTSDSIKTPLPVKIVVPLTEWKERYLANLWHIRLNESSENGLTKPSAIDVAQIRAIDESRLLAKKGKLPEEILDEIILILNRLIDSKLLKVNG